jgi:hypothetical protein
MKGDEKRWIFRSVLDTRNSCRILVKRKSTMRKGVIKMHLVALDILAINVLAIGPMVREFKPG